MTSNIALILGAGPNVGLATVKYFSEKGDKTIAVSRNPSEEISKSADLVIKADFSNPSAIKPVFEEVKAKIGIPNVVIYNRKLIDTSNFHFKALTWSQHILE
jgi:NAD(P)-dependent dehydrogenase (short-subunit alcohol dehydrogenase family)